MAVATGDTRYFFPRQCEFVASQCVLSTKQNHKNGAILKLEKKL
jgi:hypothetical protein